MPNTAASSSQNPVSPKKQLPGLTSLRGIAALWVVLYHYSVQCLPNLDVTPCTHLIHKGYLAVDLFFMLSGFVMTHVYLSAFSESVTTRNYRSFIVARVARIYPLHVLILLLFVGTAVAAHVRGGAIGVPLTGPQSLGAFIANIFMVQGLDAGKLSWNYPTWSISVEFMAYLVFPFALPAIWHTSNRIKIAVAVLLLALLMLLAFVTRDNFDQWDGPITLLRCLPEFLLGTLLYCAYRDRTISRWFARDALAFSFLLAIGICLHFGASDFLVIILFAGLIISAVVNAGVFSTWAAAAPLIWLGNISFSLYLIHSLVQFITNEALSGVGITDHNNISVASSLALMAVMVATSLIAAHCSYSCVEIGCRQYIRSLLDIRKRRAAKIGLNRI